ncbi:hypothetical protein [Methylotuvimicrobium sp. KM2]|uniref:hypothetical protein n=1 Tax=Methylotuvimicrobium sp. KM2 TaxID=3133976 RepID=UPI00310136F1
MLAKSLSSTPRPPPALPKFEVRKVYVGADNILDADYQETYALPQAGRFVYTGARLSF